MGMADYGASNTIATIGGIIGAALSAGDKPKVPDFTPVDLNKAQSDSAASNISNFDQISALAGKTNRFNTDQIKSMLDSVAPDWQGLVSKQRGLINSELSGQIPQDVQDAIFRGSAGRSLASGTAGSQFGRNLTARDLGLTSLDLTNRGFNHAEQWLAQAKSLTPPQFNVASMFVTPSQFADTQKYNNEGKFQHDWMQNLITAAPDPFLAGVGNAIAQGAGGASTQWQFGNAMNAASQQRPSIGGFGTPGYMTPYTPGSGGIYEGGNSAYDPISPGFGGGTVDTSQSGGIWDSFSGSGAGSTDLMSMAGYG